MLLLAIVNVSVREQIIQFTSFACASLTNCFLSQEVLVLAEHGPGYNPFSSSASHEDS